MFDYINTIVVDFVKILPNLVVFKVLFDLCRTLIFENKGR